MQKITEHEKTIFKKALKYYGVKGTPHYWWQQMKYHIKNNTRPGGYDDTTCEMQVFDYIDRATD